MFVGCQPHFSTQTCRVLEQIEEANKIKAELDNTTMQRVMVALRTPNATFSASDASQILLSLNITSTFLERAKLKNPVDRKIQTNGKKT